MKTSVLWILFAVLLAAFAIPAAAQDGTTVTADDVNEVASKMYCPVCENIPLNDCGTAACRDWQNEIRIFLEDGYTEEQIIDDFVTRFGDQVVGTPRDPLLRAISLWTPWILAAVALAFAVGTIYRGRGDGDKPATTGDAPATDDLRAQLERDLNG